MIQFMTVKKLKILSLNTFDAVNEPQIEIMKTCKQQGVNDCGLFAIVPVHSTCL